MYGETHVTPAYPPPSFIMTAGYWPLTSSILLLSASLSQVSTLLTSICSLKPLASSGFCTGSSLGGAFPGLPHGSLSLFAAVLTTHPAVRHHLTAVFTMATPSHSSSSFLA